ncbi:MAG: Crp/Fnr family transcriptional regulator [Paludibacteraceae bacterium]
MKKKEILYAKLWELNPVWDTMTEEEKLWITDHVDIVNYKKNELIHSEGDNANYMWMLINGRVRIYKEGINQRAQIIRLLKPCDLFGYRAVIGGDRYTSCASAFESCTCYRVPAMTFLTLLQQNSEFCYKVLVAMARDLAVAELQTLNLTQKHIRGRLAESLLTLKKNYGLDEDGCTLSMYMSREDLANMSNMTTSNAIRTLSQFAQEGLISVDGRKIKLLNEEKIRHISRLG